MVKIGIIDSGINKVHFEGNKNIRGTFLRKDKKNNLIHSDKNIYDQIGHGNECFKIISSIITDVDYYIVKVFGKELETDIDVLIAAIETCIFEQVDIINISAGIRSDEIPELLRHVCDEAYKNDIIIVAAQHNQGFPCYPAKYEKVISVGTVDLSPGERYRVIENGCLEFFTSAVDLYPPESNWSKSTSFACAKMTGYIGYIIGKRGKMNLEGLQEELINSVIKSELL